MVDQTQIERRYPMEQVIRSLPQAYRIIKEMRLYGDEESDYRSSARESLSRILEDRMRDRIDRHLEGMSFRDESDRRNGYFSRHLLTELGDIEVEVPRTRTMSGVGVIQAYSRRAVQVDRMILSCFVLGLSTRKVSHSLMPVLGEAVSATTVSRVSRILDVAVSAFHRRPIRRSYRFLFLDGVVLKRKTGMGSVKRVVLVALGMTPEGKKEVIDFTIAHGESQAAWDAFLSDLYKRGLKTEGLELIVTDGGKGLLASLPFVYPGIPIQRCWAHKTRNVLNCIRKKDQEAAKKDLSAISHATGIRQARTALKRFADKWKDLYPRALASLKECEEELLAFLRIKDASLWEKIRTTNLIERRFRELRRRTRPMGVFSDRTSMERILYAIFAHENFKNKSGGPFLVTLT
ncbi:MAG: IS256 family transposase, partial [Dehalococcoidales bacterium]|nr:IS256 family transposase [Dehalococcoidales bacterium]